MQSRGREYDLVDCTGKDREILAAIKHQRASVDRLSADVDGIKNKADKVIESSRELLANLGVRTDHLACKRHVGISREPTVVRMRSWEEISRESCLEQGQDLSIVDVLSDSEMAASENIVNALREKFDLAHRLDLLDWGIAGLAGAIGALVDLLLVKVPSEPGRLGGKGVEGGWLSDKIKAKLKGLYSDGEIKNLENAYHTCYDASVSTKLGKKVAGLCPRSHRFQSLGHDPILGFIFGVLDIMRGEFTAIDKFGHVIRQTMPGAEQGVGLFQAIAKVMGHLKSDIGSPAGLPAPFMPLFQLLQFGDIDGRTIGQLSRAMYAKGYDFGHFLAMSIPVMVIEILVRMLYFAKRLHEGHSFAESLPVDMPFRNRQPKLQTMLFTAHTFATAVNAGKVWFTKNPMAINLPQWQWYAKVSFSQLRWVLCTRPAERLAFVDKELSLDWQQINDQLKETWSFVEK